MTHPPALAWSGRNGCVDPHRLEAAGFRPGPPRHGQPYWYSPGGHLYLSQEEALKLLDGKKEKT